MNIHEFGTENSETILLIHPSLVMWDYFEYVIPYLSKRYHLVIPALPGYDREERSDFTSVEEVAAELADWLKEHGCDKVSCIYGCSMGGSIAIRFLADGRIPVGSAVIDGGITPYRLPWIVTRLIALKDFFTILLGKIGGIRILEKAFSTDDYSEEDLRYAAEVLKMISAKTIWRTFDSCNNYSMPDPVRTGCRNVEYWVTEKEQNARKQDIAYVKKNLPQTVFRHFRDVGHGGMAVLHPERFSGELEKLIGASEAHRAETGGDMHDLSI